MPQIGGNNAQVTSHDKQAVGTSVPHLEDQLHWDAIMFSEILWLLFKMMLQKLKRQPKVPGRRQPTLDASVPPWCHLPLITALLSIFFKIHDLHEYVVVGRDYEPSCLKMFFLLIKADAEIFLAAWLLGLGQKSSDMARKTINFEKGCSPLIERAKSSHSLYFSRMKMCNLAVLQSGVCILI